MFSSEILEKCGGWNFFLLTEDIEFTVHNVVAGEKIGYCPAAVLYDEQPVTFRQSWRQRKRWARGYMQVYGKYWGKLLSGILRGSFSCFDMSMAIMPAIVISVFGLAVNLAVAVTGALTHQDVMTVVGIRPSVGWKYLSVSFRNWYAYDYFRVEANTNHTRKKTDLYTDISIVYTDVYTHFLLSAVRKSRMETDPAFDSRFAGRNEAALSAFPVPVLGY